MRPEVLYHGSPLKLEGLLRPHKAFCPSGREENNMFGVYAYDNKERAIARAIIKCEGVIDVQVLQNPYPPYAIIFSGEPQQEDIFLYEVPTETFMRIGIVQYFSSKPVDPRLIKPLKIEDFMPNLVKYADLYDMDRRYFGPD